MVKRHRTNNDLQNTTQWSKDTGQTMIYKTLHNGQKTQDKQRSTKHNTMVKRHKTNNDLQNTTQWSKDTGQTMIYKTQHNGQKTQDKQ